MWIQLEQFSSSFKCLKIWKTQDQYFWCLNFEISINSNNRSFKARLYILKTIFFKWLCLKCKFLRWQKIILEETCNFKSSVNLYMDGASGEEAISADANRVSDYPRSSDAPSLEKLLRELHKNNITMVLIALK